MSPQNTGSVLVNPGHGSLASRVRSGHVSLTRFHLCRAAYLRYHTSCRPLMLDHELLMQYAYQFPDFPRSYESY